MEDILKTPDNFGIMALLGGLGGFVIHWLGGLDQLLVALVAAMALDYLSGLLKAAHNRTLSSHVGLRGIVRKVLMLSIVALSFIVGNVVGDTLPLREVTIMFFVANEGLSILENAAEAGLPLPGKLQAALVQLRADNKGVEADD